MQHSRKIALNGMVMYLKIIINTLLTLLATRIALKNLGVESFGLYNLLASVITMLSFLNTALIISGQRFMSIAIGQNNHIELRKIFNVCQYIHLFFGGTILVSFSIFGAFFISSVLNIPQGMETTAYVMFLLMIVSSVVSVSVIPFSAMMNAKEDIYIFALTEILSCGLRCASAFAICIFSSNKLEWYTLLMTASLIIGGLAKVCWGCFKYPETKLSTSLMKDKTLRKQMMGFVGWNTLGTGATLVRNQGLAMLLNVFYGTVINAAYGIANQISGLVETFGATITTVFAPSIIQSHGAGDDQRMMRIASLCCLLTFGVCSTFAIPVMLFLPTILHLWLTEVPDYTTAFCRFFIVSFLLMQIASGINRAIYATGKIKGFMIALSIILTSIIPIGYILLRLFDSLYMIFSYLIVAQLVTLFTQLFVAKQQINVFNVRRFLVKNVIVPISLFTITIAVSYLFLVDGELIQPLWSVIVKSLLIVSIYIILFFLFIGKERQMILSVIKSKK